MPSNQIQGGEAIRLTNKTAKALRQQAKQQRTALYVAATLMTIVMAVVAVIIGIEHLIAVPITVLAIILMDALMILLARGRYVSLTGQAICTEAAARQMRGQSAEEARIEVARRDLERIKADLGLRENGDEEDEDLRRSAPTKKSAPHMHTADEHEVHMGETRVMEPASRRRRQARLQVISSDDTKQAT